MSVVVIYEQVKLENLRYVKEEELFLYPCPCGDEFTFYIVQLRRRDLQVGRFAERKLDFDLSELLSEC